MIRSLATDTHEALAIRAEIRAVPNLFGGPADLQGWVQAPERAAQFVGFVVEGDGDRALAALEAKVRLYADDIVMDMGGTTPPPAQPASLVDDFLLAIYAEIAAEQAHASPPAPAAQQLPKPKPKKAPKRQRRYDLPDAGDVRLAYRLDYQRDVARRDLLERAA